MLSEEWSPETLFAPLPLPLFMEDMLELARPAAELLRKQERVLLVSHIDADGISAAGISSSVLDRLGIEYDAMFLKSIEPEGVKKVRDRNMFTWFTDLGSGSISLLSGIEGIITDHHVPEAAVPSAKDRGNILSYCAAPPTEHSFIHINPHLCGHDGTTEISGAGAAFVLALAVDRKNKDLASLAIVGAVGDMQDNKERRLIGLNREILAMGEETGMVVAEEDIRFFGRESRGLPKLLMYASEPSLPGLEEERKAVAFLSELGIPLQNNRGWWRRWLDLAQEEKEVVIEGLREYLVSRGLEESASLVTGEVYSLPNERPGSGFYDAKEFSTMLNSCGRYDRADVGLELAKGDRGLALKEAKELRKGHRRNLVTSLNMLKE
ncbi:MAG: DHH family phosphoesterase, partial [Thermoplasmata archaeon]|nr:DHH family phosphoesterase [Thermoplasmata archaeon]